VAECRGCPKIVQTGSGDGTFHASALILARGCTRKHFGPILDANNLHVRAADISVSTWSSLMALHSER